LIVEVIMEHTEKGKIYTNIVLEVFKLSGAFVNVGDELVKHLGLTSARWKVLGAISLSGAPVTVAKIAHMMGGVQRLADVMAGDGIVAYAENPYHKKAKLVYMTEKGKELYAKADDLQMDWANNQAENIDIEKMQTALETLKEMEMLVRR